MIGIYMTVTSITAWINTVKEIDSSCNTFQDICRSTNSHQISRLVLWKMRHHRIQNAIHLFMGLSHCQSANCVAIQIQLGNGICMSDTDILINSTLVDSKKQLFLIYCIRKAIQSAPAILWYDPQNSGHTPCLPHCLDIHQMPWQWWSPGLTESAYFPPDP